MCVSRIKGRNTSAPIRTQTTHNEWAQVQDRRRKKRQGYNSARYSDIEPREHATINNVEAKQTYSNDAKCYGSVPTLIDLSVTWRIVGGNMNGLRPCGVMEALLTVSERLRALQAETIAFWGGDVEWHKYQLRDNAKTLHKSIWRSKNGIQHDIG
jgi:hypothetical protein